MYRLCVAVVLATALCLAIAEHQEQKHLLGGDDHDLKPHKQRLLGENGHGVWKHNPQVTGKHGKRKHKKVHAGAGHGKKKHNKKLLGADDHDLKTHGQRLIGGDGHDTWNHGQRLIGGDGHDTWNHGQLLGADGHDARNHAKQLLGGDGHDARTHGQALLGGGDHDTRTHGRPLLGGDDHDTRTHGQPLLGGDDHDTRTHGQPLLGGDDHDTRTHDQHLLGGDDHDTRTHGQHLLGGDDHDTQTHGQRLLGSGDHDKKPHGAKLSGHREHLAAFKQFMGKHGKTYSSFSEYKKRFSIFRDNMKKAEMLQQQDRGSATYGVTKFSDLTEAEFRSKYLGLRPDLRPAQSRLEAAQIPEVDDLPENFDWRDHGVVTPVKNQGMCGSCWAFSVTGNVEGQWAIKHQHLYSLSEQELVDCDTTDEGCNGGMPENAYEAIMQLGGLESEDDYPYQAHETKCHLNTTLMKVTVNGSVELPEDEVALAKWLVKNGPVSIGINANALQFYGGGVSHPLRFLCNPENLDHGMLIVGFGVHTTKYLHRRQPYWIVKNSWGEDWGEKGYYRVYRGDGTCGVNKMVTSAIVP